MSRKIIWIVTVMIGLAMAALIILQAYWIKNAIQVNKRQFDQLISRSMIDIANEIEWNETEELISRQLDQLDPLLTGPGSFNNTPGQDSGYQDKNNFNKQSFRSDAPPQDMRRNNSRDTALFQERNASRLSPSDIRQDNNLTEQDRRIDKDDLISNRRNFVNRVLASMLDIPPSIEERISREELEEIINRKLIENGLEDIHYEYAVLRWNNEIAYQSPSFNIGAEAEYYNVLLFPDDLLARSNSLTLYFPQKKNSLFESVSYMAFSSLILSLVIVVGFILTVYVIFRQKRLSEIRSDFVSNMTHELKTPISTISLASQMLGDKSIPLEVKNPDQISKIIGEECRRLGIQVEKVLQTAIFDKGKLKLRLQEINIHEIIENAIENFSIQIKSRNGKISSSLNATDYLIFADQVHITNVLSNLIDNAIKYCEHDPQIYIETMNKGSNVSISIKDNGIGISKNDQKRIFEKFYRVPTGNIHTVKGFGLGLSYVKMILEEHQGHIELESELFEGSKFNIILPVQVKD